MSIKKEHKGLYLAQPNNHGLQTPLIEEEENKKGEQKMKKIIIAEFEVNGTEHQITEFVRFLVNLWTLEEVANIYVKESK